jgi:hypothetical protein
MFKRNKNAVPKRSMIGLQICGSLTVYEDDDLIGFVDVTDDNRFQAFGDADCPSYGIFNDIREAVKAIQYHKPATTAA